MTSTVVEACADYDRGMDGDADLASVGALLAEPARAKVLLALSDGRSLPASMLAAEAGSQRRRRAITSRSSSTEG